jgi:peptidoglycan/xylan/chitin deacetylase (PgdA/CDA1 family)
MRWLWQNNFIGVSVRDFLQANQNKYKIIITFDDGHLSNYMWALPLLKKYKFTATFFVVPAWVGTEPYMTWDQIRELAKSGMEIGSHTLTHPFLIKLSLQQIKSEFADSKRRIEDKIQQPCDYVAIPYGFTEPEYEEIAQECGYKGICDSKVSFRSDFNPAFCRIHRIGVRSYCDVDWLMSVMRGKWFVKTKMVLSDRIKIVMKKNMGLESWLLLRNEILKFKYKMN